MSYSFDMSTTARSEPWDDLDCQMLRDRPRSWTSLILLAQFGVLTAASGAIYYTLGAATTLAVALVFWVLFWND